MVSKSVPKKISKQSDVQVDQLVKEESKGGKKIKWLKRYLDERNSELIVHERELEILQAIVSGLRANILMHKQLLEKLQTGEELDRSNLPEVDITASSVAANQHRNPTEMLYPQYKGMKLADIIAKVLSRQSPLTTTELCRIIYDSKSREEFDRARNSLSTELRSGAKVVNPRWRKIGRNAYAAL